MPIYKGSSEISKVYKGSAALDNVHKGTTELWTNAVAPSVSTLTATSIATTSMTIRGNVTSDGGGSITERGFYFGTNASSATSNTKYTVTGTTGTYSRSMTGLSSGTTYYWWAYATNSAGTTYGSRQNASTTQPAHGVTVTRTSGGFDGQSVGYACNLYGDPSQIYYQTNTNTSGGTVTINCYNSTFGSCSPPRSTSATVVGWPYTKDVSGTNMIAYLPNNGSDSSFGMLDYRDWNSATGTQTGGTGYQYISISRSGYGTTYTVTNLITYS